MKKSKIIRGGNAIIIVDYKLHHLKGNKRPYFSITGTIGIKQTGGSIHDRFKEEGQSWMTDTCGCIHEEIEKYFPGQFSDLISLHLSDDNGAPMHGIANAWYYFQQAYGLYRVFDWYDAEPATNDLSVLYRHLRVSETEMAPVIARVVAAIKPEEHIKLGESVKNSKQAIQQLERVIKDLEKLPSHIVDVSKQIEELRGEVVTKKLEHERSTKAVAALSTKGKKILDEYIATLYPRWEAEAKAAVNKHGIGAIVHG